MASRTKRLPPGLTRDVARFDARATARAVRDAERSAPPGAIGVVRGDIGISPSRGIVNQEILRELEGSRKYRRYAEMMLDPVVRTGIEATTLRIRRLEWSVQAAGTDAAESGDAAFLREILADMAQPWEHLVDGLLTFLPLGWAWCECLFKLRRGPTDDPDTTSRHDDGRVGLAAIELRPQDTLDHWEFDARKRAIGMWQRVGLQSPVLIPLAPGGGSGGSLHLRTSAASGDPESEAWLRRVYVPWYYKAEFLRFLGQGVERDVAGLPLARIPAEMIRAAGTDYTRWRTLVTQLRQHRQNGVVIPGDRDEKGERIFDLELLKGESGKQFDLKVILEWLDREILLGLGADWLLLGHGERGSWSLASERTHEHALRVASVAILVRDAFNYVLIPRLFALNPSLGRTGRLPQIVHGDIEGVGLGVMAEAYERLSKGGFPFGRADEAYFRRLGGLPTREENEELDGGGEDGDGGAEE